MNKAFWILCGYLLLTTPALAAGINVPGELSHVAGGALIAGGVTATVADKYWPEHRSMIGFTVSTVVILAGEGIQMGQGEEFSSSLLDIASHTIGAMIGATITDRYLLLPVVERDNAGNAKVGMIMKGSF